MLTRLSVEQGHALRRCSSDTVEAARKGYRRPRGVKVVCERGANCAEVLGMDSLESVGGGLVQKRLLRSRHPRAARPP